jgi:hypothetical protein
MEVLMRGRLSHVPLIAAFLLLPGLAFAQVGSIAGVVRDVSGGVVPGVTVEVTSPALIEKVRSTITDDNGRYQIPALPVGTYSVTFTLSGFSVVRRDNIILTSDFTAPVNAQLTVGNISETVSVVAESPAVDIQNARVQHVFQGDEVALLPTERDLPSLLNLVPALSTNAANGICNGGIGGFCNPIGAGFNSHTSAIDADGLNQGRVMVDGMVLNRGANTGGFSINTNTGATNGLSIDTANAQEIAFTLSGALGESETGGASINIVPRTGGNRYSGEYFTSYTRNSFFANNRGTHLAGIPSGVTAYVMDFDVNGAFGGPIRRDRVWFYLQARKRGDEQYPNAGGEPGFANLNLGQFAANYQPDRTAGPLTYSNAYANADLRLTWQATQRNKINVFWSEQDACTNPCYGMINIVDSPEGYFSLQNRPNRLQQISWTNPYTNRILLEAGLSVVATHQDSTRHREYPNIREIPRVCERGPTTGLDSVSPKVNGAVTDNVGGAGACSIFNTLISGSVNEPFPAPGGIAMINDDTYRSRASASYVTGSHNVKIGWDGAYFSEKTRNEVNDSRLTYHYETPPETCLANIATDPWACGNMTRQWPGDPQNLQFRRPRPVGFQMNTGIGVADERVWFGALYAQDQWTLSRFTLNGAIRYDRAQSRYGSTCIGPDIFVPVQANGSNFWCSEPTTGVKYTDFTPRWGMAWDVFGDGKTSVKWNMGKYLQAAGFGGVYTDNNPARRSTNNLTRAWDDKNGNRLVECNFGDPNPHTHPSGDVCGTMLQATGPNAGLPTAAFAQFGRPPNSTQLANPDSFCGRTEHSSLLHQRYCEASGQNLMSGSGVRRSEWQFGLGIQREILPRLSAEVTYNWRKYQNLTDQDTVSLGCDYFLGADPEQCFDNLLNYVGVNHDFFSVRAPVDPRLPDGGGYLIKGVSNQKVQGNLGGQGGVTTIQKALEYSWGGVDTNFVYRGRGGFRISGGTSTGRSQRNTCRTDGDNPNVKGREGNEYGGGCMINNPYQTNVRGNASYTVPWVDVLLGVVFQSRPGVPRNANWQAPSTLAIWEPSSAHRTGTQFFTGGNNPAATTQVNLLDIGDLYGERVNIVDLTFRKNIRFVGKRASFGVDVYNLFNSDAIIAYNDNFTATFVNGQWQADNPATPAVEVNNWGNPSQILNPRFARLSMTFTW